MCVNRHDEIIKIRVDSSRVRMFYDYIFRHHLLIKEVRLFALLYILLKLQLITLFPPS